MWQALLRNQFHRCGHLLMFANDMNLEIEIEIISTIEFLIGMP